MKHVLIVLTLYYEGGPLFKIVLAKKKREIKIIHKEWKIGYIEEHPCQTAGFTEWSENFVVVFMFPHLKT